MRIGAFKPYHHRWRFVVFAVVVFASASCWGSPPRKGRLGGPKETGGGCFAVSIAYLITYLLVFYFLFYTYRLFVFQAFRLSRLQLPKNNGQNFRPHPKILPQNVHLPLRNKEIPPFKAVYLASKALRLRKPESVPVELGKKAIFWGNLACRSIFKPIFVSSGTSGL